MLARNLGDRLSGRGTARVVADVKLSGEGHSIEPHV